MKIRVKGPALKVLRLSLAGLLDLATVCVPKSPLLKLSSLRGRIQQTVSIVSSFRSVK